MNRNVVCFVRWILIFFAVPLSLIFITGCPEIIDPPSGQSVDTDGDGVDDDEDQCENTPDGADVDSDGCEIPDEDLTLQVIINPEGSGTVDQSADGDDLILTAEANDTWSFDHWSIENHALNPSITFDAQQGWVFNSTDNSFQSSANPITITLHETSQITALFISNDEDNDGILNEDDKCAGHDDTVDVDNDGTPDGCDECVNDPNKTEPGNCGCGVADSDSDFDADGTLDCNDNCPSDPNKTEPGNCGCGEPETDTDLDGISDCIDNCPTTANPNQSDDDSDGLGNVCEPDYDNDGVIDDNDNCFFIMNSDQIDNDSDGLGDVCDQCPNDDENDRDGDGVCGDIDQCPDSPVFSPVDESGCPLSIPAAIFTMNPDPPLLNEEFSLDASLSFDIPETGAITNYSWNISSSGESVDMDAMTVTHVFTTPDTYTITLTVSDDEEPPNNDSLTRTIVIPESITNTWTTTQGIAGIVPWNIHPERYDFDDQGQLITAHITTDQSLAAEIDDSGSVAVISKSLPLNVQSLIWRIDNVLGEDGVVLKEYFTLNTFSISFIDLLPTLEFNYDLSLVLENISFFSVPIDISLILRFSGSQTGDLSPDESRITWSKVDGVLSACLEISGDLEIEDTICQHLTMLDRFLTPGFWVDTTGATCGNGVIEAGEQCDPPNETDCNANCLTIGKIVQLNDSCEEPESVSEGLTLYTNLDATTDGPKIPQDCGIIGESQIQSDVWFCYTAACTEEVQVNLCGSKFATSMAVYEGCDCPTTTPIACGDIGCFSGFGSQSTFQAQSGASYLIRVGGIAGLQGDGRLNISCGTDECGEQNGDCFSANDSRGCNDPTCCQNTCERDPYCCEVEWDAFCASQAAGFCNDGFESCITGEGECSVEHESAGCGESDCCEIICGDDPYCCTHEWDDICADNAKQFCD